MNITFFPVKDTPSKLSKLCRIASQHMSQKEPLLFLVPDKAAFDFLDKLLWSYEYFLPHPTPLLTISMELLSFPSVFNLRPSALEGTIKTVYEFEDHTSAEKFQLSKHRYQTYRDQNFPIIIEN
ncbi:MAG TPA: DNA polymerase III subunit chi [Rhabdochlamydiaceae bacterium]|jgi:DNA polymerase IIIc chi subunit|nr:DNA polymerase III subunit chi [Rhabdochlamydiaceae bacterium]